MDFSILLHAILINTHFNILLHIGEYWSILQMTVLQLDPAPQLWKPLWLTAGMELATAAGFMRSTSSLDVALMQGPGLSPSRLRAAPMTRNHCGAPGIQVHAATIPPKSAKQRRFLENEGASCCQPCFRSWPNRIHVLLCLPQEIQPTI